MNFIKGRIIKNVNNNYNFVVRVVDDKGRTFLIGTDTYSTLVSICASLRQDPAQPTFNTYNRFVADRLKLFPTMICTEGISVIDPKELV